jgi:hypothetical protein
LSIPVTVSAPQDLGEVGYKFQFHTDAGLLESVASVLMLPIEAVSPRTLASAALVEDDDWQFDLVYRQIGQDSAPRIGGILHCPTQFRARKLSTQRGTVARAPDCFFEDTTYRVTLIDRKKGLFKEVFRLERPGAEKPGLEIPVVWTRVGFLSSMPERVYLGPRAARVFLRCPDERVELTRVVSVPRGVKAVVSSPREVSIALADNAPLVLNGAVTVETTMSARDPLRIPVVRFAVSSTGQSGRP